MKKTGIVLFVLSILIIFLALNMDVTVGTSYNIGLLNDRQNITYLSGVLFLSGSMFFGFGVVAKEEVHNIKAFALWTLLTPIILIILIKVIPIIQKINEHQLQVNSNQAIIEARTQEKNLKRAKENSLKEDSDKYIDNNDGTVTSKSNELIWQRCSVGQIWTGVTCSGDAKVMSWDDAIKLTNDLANYNDWRLPTTDELLTIVYCPNSTNPKVCITDISRTINTMYFPNTPDKAWTSMKADTDDTVMIVSFSLGLSYSLSKNKLSSVRLVRSDKKY